MSEIVLSRVNKHYGNTFHAVKDVDLTIGDKEFIVLVGPSGCGKSTTLRMIAGLEDISSGEIRIGDRVVNTLPPRDRDIAMVFQNYALYLHMTVYDNLAFGLRNKKEPEAKIKQAIDHVADILGLGEMLQRKPRQLSGGQQQRVALGRCIVRNPQAFLFDEPLSNLDAKLRTQMRLEIKRLRTRVPTTSVFVTHDQVEAMTLGDRVVVMRDGSIQQCGTPLQVYSEPANKFVAGFIGAPAMNFLSAEIRAEEGELIAHAPGLRIPVPACRRESLSAWTGRKVILGMRPEHLSVKPAQGPIGAAQVEVVEQLGSEMVLETLVEGQTITVSRVDPTHPVGSGEKVDLHLTSEQLHFFDPDTEWRIQ
ncbi:sn-glycerol 3-phosphate transport system ATP-binding protein OS=Castellaniella defragrans OX=75697 GN=HNR28_002827 PE=4 SV=1 [Castellaniella defragrans]